MDLEKSDCQPYDEGEKEMSKYLRYIIRNTEPLRIANNASSQSGQTEAVLSTEQNQHMGILKMDSF